MAESEPARKGAHTPWRIDTREYAGVEWDHVIRNARNEPIASVLSAGWDKPSAAYHARLIAESPALEEDVARKLVKAYAAATTREEFAKAASEIVQDAIPILARIDREGT